MSIKKRHNKLLVKQNKKKKTQRVKHRLLVGAYKYWGRVFPFHIWERTIVSKL